MASFLQNPNCPGSGTPENYRTLRHDIPWAIPSRQVVREALAGKNTHFSSLVYHQELATVSGTSRNLAYHAIGDKVKIRYQDCRYRLIVALLLKVGCRGHTPRLKDTSMFGKVAQA